MHDPPTPTPTPIPELNDIVTHLVAEAQQVLGDNFAGAYVVGSFALGDGDLHSDCDFLIATHAPLTGSQQQRLRQLHLAIVAADGHWNRRIEGSYAPIDDLRSLSALGREWMYVEYPHANMEWSTHCNRLEHRWVLRHHGVVLAGASLDQFADIPAEMLREDMRRRIPVFMDELAAWIRVDEIAWAQRYAVTTLCRMLYTLRHGTVASKSDALRWAGTDLDPRWRELITRAERERPQGWDPTNRPTTELAQRTVAFGNYAAAAASAS